MECKLHNRYIYTERQSCHARTPRVLTITTEDYYLHEGGEKQTILGAGFL